MEVEINLVEDWRKLLLYFLKERGYDPDENKSVEDIAFQYFNVKLREIFPCKRYVNKSSTFECPTEFKDSLDNIENQFRNGENVNPYLS